MEDDAVGNQTVGGDVKGNRDDKRCLGGGEEK